MHRSMQQRLRGVARIGREGGSRGGGGGECTRDVGLHPVRQQAVADLFRVLEVAQEVGVFLYARDSERAALRPARPAAAWGFHVLSKARRLEALGRTHFKGGGCPTTSNRAAPTAPNLTKNRAGRAAASHLPALSLCALPRGLVSRSRWLIRCPLRVPPPLWLCVQARAQ